MAGQNSFLMGNLVSTQMRGLHSNLVDPGKPSLVPTGSRAAPFGRVRYLSVPAGYQLRMNADLNATLDGLVPTAFNINFQHQPEKLSSQLWVMMEAACVVSHRPINRLQLRLLNASPARNIA